MSFHAYDSVVTTRSEHQCWICCGRMNPSDEVRCGTDWPAIDGARLAVDLPRWPLIILAVWLLRRRGAVHNLIAHPLLTLCRPLGEWLHERTTP